MRKELSSDGMGSDMPISVPVDLRNVLLWSFSPGGSLFLRCLRIQTVSIKAATAPKTEPGKKPARTAFVGKAGQEFSVSETLLQEAAEYCEALGVGSAILDESTAVMEDRSPAIGIAESVVVSASVAVEDSVEWSVEDSDVDSDEVEVGVEVDLVVLVEVEDDAVLSTAQKLPWQVYPNGQHAFPHLGKSSSNRVVLMTLFGWRLAFCFVTSHVIGWI